jgi:hypothetical protein
MSALKAGVNKAVQAVSVFAASHIFFCDTDRQQCMTAGKGVAMAMTVAGVLIYSIGKPPQNDAGARSGSTPAHGSVDEGERRGLLAEDEDANEAP